MNSHEMVSSWPNSIIMVGIYSTVMAHVTVGYYFMSKMILYIGHIIHITHINQRAHHLYWTPNSIRKIIKLD